MGFRARARTVIAAIREVFTEFVRDDCVPMAGSLAFFTLFSFPPILAIVVQVAGMIVGPVEARNALLERVDRTVGETAAAQFREVLVAIEGFEAGGPLATIGGLLMLLFAATMVLAQAQQALDRVWGVHAVRRGLRRFVVKRLIALVMILGFCILLVVSMTASTVLSAVGAEIADLLPAGWTGFLLATASATAWFALVTGVLAAVFKYVPDCTVRWYEAIRGALATGVLLALGREVIAWVLGTLPLGTAFGAARSLAVLLFWVFYSTAIVLWGAELTKVIARHTRGTTPT